VTLVGNDPSYLETTRLAIQRSDCVTAVSEALRTATLEQLGCGREIRVLPNFIDPQRYLDIKARGAGRAWGEEGERIIVHISNFRRVKRVLDVVRIFELVSRDHKVRLLLAGEGPDLARTEQLCRELDVSDRVVFLGTVGDVEELLSGADVFLLPSETESFGLAALEALSCEVPVVASLIGGLPEVVEDGVTGFLRPVGDVEGMAEAVDLLLRDEDLRREMGRRGRSGATERFSRDDIVGQYRELYQEVLAREPAAANSMFRGG